MPFALFGKTVKGPAAAIVKATHRLNPCMEIDADILAVTRAALASTAADWNAGTLTSTSPDSKTGALTLTPTGSPATLFSQTAGHSIAHYFKDSANGVEEYALDFFPDPSVTQGVSFTLDSLDLWLAPGTLKGVFRVVVAYYDEKWRVVPMGEPIDILSGDVVAAVGLQGVYKIDFTALSRRFIFEGGSQNTVTGTGRDSGGAARAVNVDAQGKSHILGVARGLSISIQPMGANFQTAYIGCVANATAAQFDTNSFWRVAANRNCGPYNPDFQRFQGADILHNPDEYLVTGAVPGYGAKAVTNGSWGIARRIPTAQRAQNLLYTWEQPYHVLRVVGYPSTGTSVNVLDMGVAADTNDVQLRLDDWQPQGTNLSYNLRGSNTASTGPWTSVGGMVGYWPFDVDATDQSGNGNNGTLLNGANINVAPGGKIGGGLALDGLNDYVEVPDVAALKYTGGGLTMAAWIKAAASETQGGYVFSKPWNGAGQYNYQLIYGTAGTVAIGLYGNAQSSLGFSATIPPDGSWHHIAATVDSAKNINCYIDGKLVNSGTHSITSWTPSSGDSNLQLCIGTIYPYGNGWAGDTAFGFAGNIDDARIYNRALSSVDISGLYKQTTGGTVFDGQVLPNGDHYRWYQLTSTFTPGPTGATKYATPALQAWSMVERVTISTYRYLTNIDATCTADPVTGQSSIAELKLPVLNAGRQDFRDLASQLGSNYTPGSLEAHVYARNTRSGDRLFLNAYKLENRNPSFGTEEMVFVSGMDRLSVKIPTAVETYHYPATGQVAITNVPFVSGTTYGVTIAAAPWSTGALANYRMHGVTGACAGLDYPILSSPANIASTFYISVPSPLVLPVIGDTFEIHSDVTTRVGAAYVTQDFAAVYSDLLSIQSAVPARYRGRLPATTGRTTTYTLPADGVKALDVMQHVALHCGGFQAWNRGKIDYVDFYGPKDSVEVWDERHYVSITTSVGADRRAPSVQVRYGYQQDTGKFTNQTVYDDYNTLLGWGRSNLFDIHEVPDDICKWNDLAESKHLANKLQAAWKSGVRLWNVKTVLNYPWLEQGDAVTILTDQYTDRRLSFGPDGTTDNSTPVAGRTSAVCVIVGKNLWGNEFIVAIKGLDSITQAPVAASGSVSNPPVGTSAPVALISHLNTESDDTVWNLRFNATAGTGGGGANLLYSAFVKMGFAAEVSFDSGNATALPRDLPVNRDLKQDKGIRLTVTDSLTGLQNTARITVPSQRAEIDTLGRLKRAKPWDDLDFGTRSTTSDGLTLHTGALDSGLRLINRHFGKAASTDPDTAESIANGTTKRVIPYSILRLSDGSLLSGVDYAATIGDTTAGTVAKRHGIFFSEVFDAKPTTTQYSQGGGNTGTLVLSVGASSVSTRVYQMTIYEWWTYSQFIPFNPSKLYRLRIRYRATVDAGMGLVYAWLQAFDVNGTATNSNGGYEYVAVFADTPTVAQGWKEVTTWVKGASTAYGGSLTPSTDPTAPTNLHVNTVQIRPGFAGNYSTGTGTVQFDYFQIEELDEDAEDRIYQALASGGHVKRGRAFDDGTYAAISTTVDGFTLHTGALDSGLRPLNRFLSKTSSSGADSLDGVPEGTTYKRVHNTAVNPSGYVDFTGAGFVGKNLANVPDDTTTRRYAAPVADATSDVRLLASGNVTLGGNNAFKNANDAAWDGQVYSLDGYTGGAFASAVVTASQSHTMFGLNTDPATDANFTSIDYAWYINQPSSALTVYESGTDRTLGLTWAANDVLAVTYDGSNVRYFQNGTVRRTVAVATGLKLYFDSSFYATVTNGLSQLKNIRFGPMSSNDAASVGAGNFGSGVSDGRGYPLNNTFHLAHHTAGDVPAGNFGSGINDSRGYPLNNTFHFAHHILDDVGETGTYKRTTADQRDGGGRGFSALDANNRLVDSLRLPMLYGGGTKSYQAGGANVTSSAHTINIAAHTLHVGANTVTYNSGSVSVGSNATFYVYADDPTYAGGAVTYLATSTLLSMADADGRYFVGQVTTVTVGAGTSPLPGAAGHPAV